MSNLPTLTPSPAVTVAESHPVARPWQEVLAVYLDTLDSRATRDAYRRGIAGFMGYAGVGTLWEVEPQQLTGYRGELVRRVELEALTPATVNQRLAACRRFLEFARMTGQSPLSKEIVAFCLKGLRSTVKRPYQVLSRAEMRKLLATREPGSRDHALLTLMLGTGLRASEACRLRLEDLVGDEAGDLSVRVRQGKGRKDRVVPLAPQVAQAVTDYLSALGNGGARRVSEPLFPSRQGTGRMSRRRLAQLVGDAVKAAGVTKPISPHSLRHSYGIALLRNGASPVAVGKLLGHASIATTQRYLDHLEAAELKRWALNPL